MCALGISSSSSHIGETSYERPSSVATPFESSFTPITPYEIESRQASESAWIFFVRDPFTSKPLVMKVLRPYRDMRYNLSSVTERQRCQLEAFHQNRIFTPEVYVGMARLYNQPSEEDHVLIGNIIAYPTQEVLEQDAEYALIMEHLPEERRLDQLLKGDENSVQVYLHTLISHIAFLHEHRALSLTAEDRASWGSYSQLQRKLEENLAFLALVLDKVNPSVKAIIERLSTGLREVFTEEHYAHFLEQRVQAGYIKHCHGDIKSLNIWIMPGSADDEQQHSSVKLLDAIDFNPLFCNIDILSDFAMLVIDVQARTSSTRLANTMIDDYLMLSHQDNIAAHAVLGFYLIEKAIVSATINILFDNQPDLGLYLLNLAQEHLDSLVTLLAVAACMKSRGHGYSCPLGPSQLIDAPLNSLLI
jgi:aminoglycoside phosphotransferase family enzyme